MRLVFLGTIGLLTSCGGRIWPGAFGPFLEHGPDRDCALPHRAFIVTVTYVTKSGKTLDEDAVRTRIKVGVPVHVHYLGEGDNMLVDRVVLDKD